MSLTLLPSPRTPVWPPGLSLRTPSSGRPSGSAGGLRSKLAADGLSAFSLVCERVVSACKPLQLAARPPLHTLALMYSLLNTHHIKAPARYLARNKFYGHTSSPSSPCICGRRRNTAASFLPGKARQQLGGNQRPLAPGPQGAGRERARAPAGLALRPRMVLGPVVRLVLQG